MRGVWRSAWIILRRKRLSTALTAIGIAVGTALVVLISGISNVGSHVITQELEDMGINGISVSASKGLTINCLTSIRSLPMVSQAMPLLVLNGGVSVWDEEYRVVSCGIDAGADQVISLKLLHGRLLSQGDVAGEHDVCVIDETLALEAFGRSNAVGESLTIVLESVVQDFRVVGVTATDSSLLQSVTSMIPYMVYVPYTTLQAYATVDTFDQIAVRVDTADDTELAKKAIDRALSRLDDEIGTLTTENLATQRARLDAMVSAVSLALTAIGGVSLLVSAFGIMTVMLSSVHERTREIGIKKAIGATKARIMAEFLAGAVLMTGLGAVSGAAIGVVGLSMGCMLIGVLPVWSVSQLLSILVLTLLLGAVFGAYPAYRAAGLRPVDALRQEG